MSDDAVLARIRENFARQAFMATLGASLTRVAPGEVEISLPVREALSQQQGFLHAGVTATIADSACGYAALTLMPEGRDVVSVEFKVNLLAPATGDRVVARAHVIRAGRTLTVCRATVFAVAGDGAEKPVLEMQGTMMAVPLP
jgi:uncharacterized protein (TIGR00369 family)